MKQDRWRKIEQIYHQALRQGPDERADFVKEACGSDETLLREIESLLRHAPEADRFIESPAVDIAARSLADDQEDSSQALIGKTLSHYRIVEEIGSGGMGVVFRATDTRLDLDVALKVLRDDALADEATRKRFRKEAMALSRLNHSNIATFHVFDRRDEIDFLVMEYVEGTTLANMLAQGPLREKEAAKLAAQVHPAVGRLVQGDGEEDGNDPDRRRERDCLNIHHGHPSRLSSRARARA